MPDWELLRRTKFVTQARFVSEEVNAPLDCRCGQPVSKAFPRILKAKDFTELLGAIHTTRLQGRPVIALYGAHVLKVGLAGLLCQAFQHRILTHLATNGAGAIHDVELARYGRTSEDVAEGLMDGSFGMALETGRDINVAISRAAESSFGLGEGLGRWLIEEDAPFASTSPLAVTAKANIPLTVHVAIGTDITHQHPEASGAAIGETSLRDFHRLCDAVGLLRGGGVVLCFGSAVLLPEVFLKAINVARNLDPSVGGFTTAVFDMNVHYRPLMNVVQRPPQQMGGQGYYFVGHHEIMLPILFHDLFLRFGV